MAHRQHIVLVDDDASMNASVATYFDDQGFEVSRVASSFDLRRVLAAKGADLIILDPRIDGNSGLDVFRRSEAECIPVIVISGNEKGEAERVAGLELGAD